MDLVNKEIEEYAAAHTSNHNELLEYITRDTYANVLMARMLSGKHQGRLLSVWSHVMRPKRILEIGTFTGYSCLCMAEGLAKGAVIDTIDINEELEDRVKGYFKKSQYSSQINYIIGNALDVIPKLANTYDLVFIDADKINYQNYYDLVIDKLNPNGIIIADNVLWSGKILTTAHNKKIDKDSQALMDFNDYVQQDNRVENILLTLRDGLLIIRKK